MQRSSRHTLTRRAAGRAGCRECCVGFWFRKSIVDDVEARRMGLEEQTKSENGKKPADRRVGLVSCSDAKVEIASNGGSYKL